MPVGNITGFPKNVSFPVIITSWMLKLILVKKDKL